MSAQDEARDALYSAIAKRAEGVLSLGDASQEEKLDKLADAYSKVTFGPQGGELWHGADDHTTSHEGEQRDRPTGFGS